MKSTAILATCAALMLSGTAFAQSTFGEFLDMGATKVLKAEWLSILPASIRAPSQTGSDVHLVFSADGTLSGNITTKAGEKSPITGTWTMDENGRRCINERFIAWSMAHSECTYMYRFRNKYYGTLTDSDRNIPVRNPLVAYETNIKK